METAALIGLNILDFWELTPYEFGVTLSAYHKRVKQEREERISLAYMTAKLGRVKEMPTLKELLEQNEEKKEQTAETMFEEIKRLNEAFGGSTY